MNRSPVRSAINVSLDDRMVIDSQGSIWKAHGEMWAYLSEDGWSLWDARYELPEEYEPYVVLDASARKAVNPMKGQ